MKLTKYLCHVLTIKDMLDDGIYTLSYFHKNSVTSYDNWLLKKNCDNWKGSW